MSKKKAFITGIGGQDGSYLAEYLDGLGYDVYGMIRRNSVPEHQQSRLSGGTENIKLTTPEITSYLPYKGALIF